MTKQSRTYLQGKLEQLGLIPVGYSDPPAIIRDCPGNQIRRDIEVHVEHSTPAFVRSLNRVYIHLHLLPTLLLPFWYPPDRDYSLTYTHH